MKPETLMSKLDDLLKETNSNRLKWIVEIKTSEYENNIEKNIIQEENKTWTMDECYVSYSCNFHGENFVMVTYEDIEKCDNEIRSFNMVFLPPTGIRLFQMDSLISYSVEMSNPLALKLHTLWDTLLAKYKESPERITFIRHEWND